MKKIFCLIGASLLLTRVEAQTADSVVTKVTYQFNHVLDTSQRDTVHTEQMALLIGHKSSLFISADKFLHDEQRIKDIKSYLKTRDYSKIGTEIDLNYTAESIYQLQGEKKMFTKKALVKNYLVEETLPVIKWKIGNKNRVISGFKCQNATTHFKGRDYEAWFAPELPFQSGPWQLSGLPGLIIEAHDKKNEIAFKFLGMQKDTAKTETAGVREPSGTLATIIGASGLEAVNLLNAATISLPKDAVQITPNDFVRLLKAWDDDPDSFYAAAGLSVRRAIPAGNQPIEKPVKHENPLELKDPK